MTTQQSRRHKLLATQPRMKCNIYYVCYYKYYKLRPGTPGNRWTGKLQENFSAPLILQIEKCFIYLSEASCIIWKLAKRIFEKFWFFVGFFVTCLKVPLPSEKRAWQPWSLCHPHVTLTILQPHHKKSAQKVSSRYLHWFLRYLTFCVMIGFIFTQIQPSWVQSVPMKAEFA